jgi:hypothetical protein
MKISQNFTTTLLKAQLFFNVVSIFVNCLFSPMNKSIHSHPAKVALPPLQPLALSFLQCLITGIMESSQSGM